jgi:hypothetical protein
MKSIHAMTPELSLTFRLSYRPMQAYPDALDGVERVGSFYRVPVRHMPGEWLATVTKVGDD